MLKKDFFTRNSGKLLWTTVLLAAIPVLVCGKGIVVGDTVTSRLATVYALAHDHTWRIDRPVDSPPNPFENRTVDKVTTRDGRLISSKPPILPLFMTIEYVAMRRIFGWNLENEAHLRPILNAMIITLIRAPHIIGLIFFALTLRMFMSNFRDAALLLLALAYATPLPGYACQLNNHTPAAAALIVALYFGLGVFTGNLPPAWWRFMAFGLCSSLVFVLDIPVTIFPAFMGVLLLSRFPRQSILWAGLGALPLLALHFGLMTATTGNPLPVQTQEDMYNFRNSYWRNPIGVDGMNEKRLVYFFHMHFGRFGTFLLFPVLLLGLPGCLKGIADRACPARLAVAAGGAAFVVMTAYYVMKTNNYGGAAYGFRWHIGAVPVLLLLSIPAIPTMTRSWRWALLMLLLAVSVFSAWECLQAPWGASHEWTCRWIFGAVN
mgnify:CR=1 FL=1